MVNVAIILTIPTAVLRTPRLLSYLSAVGTIATISVVTSVLSYAIIEGDMADQVARDQQLSNVPPYRSWWTVSGLPVGFGLIAYTFSGHAIVPSIYTSLKRPQDFEKMVNITYLCVVFCCCIVACSGYYMFGDTVEDQITITLEKALVKSNTGAEKSMTMITWLMILTAFSKFTLTMFPLALGMEEIIGRFLSSDKTLEAFSAFIKIVLIMLSLMVAIFVPSFSFLCSLVGLLCTMIVSVIFPAAAHLKLFGSELSITEKVVDWIFIILGLIAAVVGTNATFNLEQH